MLYRLRLPALLVIVLLAWGLRLWGIAGLHLFGDSSYSVYYAAKDLATITHDRIYDGHPPLHYYILHFMGLVAGYNEVAMRLPSLAADALTCCLLYRFGVDFWRSRFTGMAAALLWAISPFALFYGRMPRMYALMAFLCVLSLYLLCRALQHGSWKSWLAYGAATLAALFTQYFSAWIVPVAVLYVLTSQKSNVKSRKLGLQERKSAILYSIAGPSLFDLRRVAENTALRALTITLGVVGLIYLPWVLFAFVSSATTTAGIISNAPPPEGLVGYLEQVLIPQSAGVIVPVGTARLMLLSIIPALLGVVLAWSDLRNRVQERKAMLLAILWWVVPVAIIFLIFLKFPYLARQRFFLYIAPAALLLIVAGVRALARRNVLLGVAALVLVIANFCYGSYTVLQAEPRMMEPDAMQITQQLEREARPGDAVILHAFWQGGYLNAHYHGPPLMVYALNDIPPDQWQRILGKYPRVWLAMYEVGERDPKYPLEQILDQNMAKLEVDHFGPSRLALYAAPPSGAETGRPMTITGQDGQPLFELSAPEIGPGSIHAGEALTASWTWQALQTTSVRYTVYLQLRDASGRTYAGRDSEPESGVVPTMNWQPGESHPDIRGLLVPPQTPAGTYTLWMGLYETGSGKKSARVQVEGEPNLHEEVPIGTVTVLPPVGLSPIHVLQEDFNGIYTLSGYTLPELDYPPVLTTTSYVALLDNPVSQTEFKQSYAPGDILNLTLFWSATHPPEQKYSAFVHLSDPSGHVVAQADLPLSIQAGSAAPVFYTLSLPANLPTGEYTLITGVYDPASGTRLELPPDLRGRRANAITLQQIQVTEPHK